MPLRLACPAMGTGFELVLAGPWRPVSVPASPVTVTVPVLPGLSNGVELDGHSGMVPAGSALTASVSASVSS